MGRQFDGDRVIYSPFAGETGESTETESQPASKREDPMLQQPGTVRR